MRVKDEFPFLLVLGRSFPLEETNSPHRYGFRSLFTKNSRVDQLQYLQNVALFYKDLFFRRVHLRRRVRHAEVATQATLLQKCSLDIDFASLKLPNDDSFPLPRVFLPVLWNQKRIPLLSIDCQDEAGESLNVARSSEYRAAMSLALLGVVTSLYGQDIFCNKALDCNKKVEWCVRFLEETFALLKKEYDKEARVFEGYSNVIRKELGNNTQVDEFCHLLGYVWKSYVLCVVLDRGRLEKNIGLMKLSTLIPIALDKKRFGKKVIEGFKFFLNPARTLAIDLPDFGDHSSACHASFKAPEGTEIVNAEIVPADESDLHWIDSGHLKNRVSKSSSGEFFESQVATVKNDKLWRVIEWVWLDSNAKEGIGGKIEQDKVNITKAGKERAVALLVFDEKNLEMQDVDLYLLPFSSWKAHIELAPELRHFHYPALYILYALGVLFLMRIFTSVSDVMISGLSIAAAFLANAQKHYHLSRLFRAERYFIVGVIVLSVPLNMLLGIDRPIWLTKFLHSYLNGFTLSLPTEIFSIVFALFYFCVAILFDVRIKRNHKSAIERNSIYKRNLH